MVKIGSKFTPPTHYLLLVVGGGKSAPPVPIEPKRAGQIGLNRKGEEEDTGDEADESKKEKWDNVR